jgi:hypothetical protein
VGEDVSVAIAAGGKVYILDNGVVSEAIVTGHADGHYEFQITVLSMNCRVMAQPSISEPKLFAIAGDSPLLLEEGNG